MVSDAKIRVAFWNTRLTPPRGSRLPEDERPLVDAVIVQLLAEGLEFIALCEVGAEDIKPLSDLFEDAPVEILEFFESEDGFEFGMCVLLRTDHLQYKNHEYIIDVVRGASRRLGLRLTVAWNDEFEFDIFLVHWSSRLYVDMESGAREQFGSLLKRSIDQRHKLGFPYTIVAGDFNDEPFNLSMTEGLRSTRDPHRASLRPEVLYNPFWRHMVPTKGYIMGSSESERRGSYYLRTQKLDRWMMIDQMLFSSLFVSSGQWLLHEAGTRVYRLDALLDVVEGSRHSIDHLPIIGEIWRR